MKRYNPIEVEKKWRQIWDENETYKVDLNDDSRKKYYSFSMLPGITGAGIHIGHGRTYQLIVAPSGYFLTHILISISYFSLLYSSSETGSHHSFDVSSPGTSTARCWNQLSGAAPCQCFTLAGTLIQSPGFISMASLPHS